MAKIKFSFVDNPEQFLKIVSGSNPPDLVIWNDKAVAFPHSKTKAHSKYFPSFFATMLKEMDTNYAEKGDSWTAESYRDEVGAVNNMNDELDRLIDKFYCRYRNLIDLNSRASELVASEALVKLANCVAMRHCKIVLSGTIHKFSEMKGVK